MEAIFLRFLFIFLTCNFSGTFTHSQNAGNYELVKVFVIARHGARAPSPTFTYPTYKVHPERWPNGLGNLTIKGYDQMFDLGKYIGARYGSYFDPKMEAHSSVDVDARVKRFRIVSTNKSRTLTSSLAFYEGLTQSISIYDNRTAVTSFESQGNKSVLLPQLNMIQVLPNFDHPNYRRDCRAYMLYDYFACGPIKDLAFKSLLSNSSTLPAFIKNNGELLKTLHKYTGIDYYFLAKAGTYIADPLTCDVAENVSYLPAWVSAIDPTKGSYASWMKLKAFSDISYQNILKHDPRLGTYAAGILTDSLISLMHSDEVTYDFHHESKSDSFIEREKAFLWSFIGHDTTLYGLMTHLGIDYEEQPHFASAIILELKKGLPLEPRLRDTNINNGTNINRRIDEKFGPSGYYVLDIYYKANDSSQLTIIKSNLDLLSFTGHYRLPNVSALVKELDNLCN